MKSYEALPPFTFTAPTVAAYRDELRGLRAAGSVANVRGSPPLVVRQSAVAGLMSDKRLRGMGMDYVRIGGITEGGATARVVRMKHTADTSFLGLSAARLSGSGVGIGIQAKGTAVIHHKDRLPHNNLELFSNSPITRLEHYRRMGTNAAAYALGEMPEPVVVPTRGEAMGSRYHARVSLIYAIETELTSEGAVPENVEVAFLGSAA